MKQDSIILNLERTCQAAIDMAARIIRLKKLGIPQESKDVFKMMTDAKLINDTLSKNLQAMVGFKNIVVHDYQKLNLDIVEAVIKNQLNHLLKFSQIITKIKF